MVGGFCCMQVSAAGLFRMAPVGSWSSSACSCASVQKPLVAFPTKWSM